MKKANKIYKEFIGNATPFRDWITVEKVHYGIISPSDMDFDTWLNEKYKINGREAWYNADGDEVNSHNANMLDKVQNGDKSWFDKAIQAGWLSVNVYDRFKDVEISTEEEQEDLTSDTLTPDSDKSLQTNTILGMNKKLVYGLGALILIGGIFWGYKKYNK